MDDISLGSDVNQQVAEYFVVCGLPCEPTAYDLSEVLVNGEEIVLSESGRLDFTEYSPPIVDIQLISALDQDNPPFGYEIVRHSYNRAGNALIRALNSDDLYICYRRGYDKPPIADIGIYSDSSHLSLKKKAILIERTVGGRSAALGKHRLSSPSYLSVMRVNKNYGIDQLALTDLCVIFKNKDELCPLGYMESQHKLPSGQFNADMHLCYKKSFIKQHILAYQPEVLLWHQATPPQQQPLRVHQQEDTTPNDVNLSTPDYDAHLAARLDDSSANQSGPPANLDIRNVADFCLPWGASIESWSIYQAPPKPVFFTFVLTDASYERLHGSALTFYEPYDISLLDMDKCFHLDLDPELVAAPKQNGGSDRLALADAELFTADELHDIERRLGVFRKSRVGEKVVGTSKTICILSRYYFGSSFRPFLSFLHQRCLGESEEKNSIPLERYLAFLFYEVPFPDLRLPNVIVDLDGHYLRLQAPREKNAASSTAISEPFASLLSILGTELCLQLLVQLLTEQKILLTSVQPDLLAHIAQALISIIYPLRWVLVYIPFIHIRCIHVIQSPSPYLIGVDSRFFEFFRLPPGENITCIDLDTRNFRAAKDNIFKDTKCLPKALYKKLKNQLLATEKRLASLHHSMRTEAQSGVPLDLKLHQQVHQVGLSIKRAFLTFMAQLLYDYRRYVLPVGSTESGILFDSEAYVKEVCDHSSRPFYRALFGTQLWADFIRDLTCVSDRTAEFEAFDNFIDDIHPGGDFEDGSVVSSGSGSSSLPHSRAQSALLANGSSPAGSFSTLDDISTDLPGGLFSTTTRLIQSDKTKVLKTPETDKEDDLAADLRDQFTWTEWGMFPNRLNNEVLEELGRRSDAVKRRQVLRPSVSMVAFYGTGLWDTSVLSNSTAAAAAVSQIANTSNSDFTRFAALAPASEEFQPQRRFVGEPPTFPVIFHVADVFGVAKLNSLLKRTQQETTACLIFDTKCRQQGNSAWAGFLMTEIYSLWFILLPAFIASLDQRFSQTAQTDAQKHSLSLQARTLLFQASCLFFRLMNTSLYTVDQVMVRILLVLLFEYGALNEQTFNSWCELPLNATSYALANQLQRELGPKLADPEGNSTVPPLSKSFSSVSSVRPHSPMENSNCVDAEEKDIHPTLIPQALSTPRLQRANVSTPPRTATPTRDNPVQVTSINLIDFGPQEPSRSMPVNEALEQNDLCNDLARLQLSLPSVAVEADRSTLQPVHQEAEGTVGQDPAPMKTTECPQPAGSPFSRGLRSIAMRSMRSINSFANQMKSVEWVAATSTSVTSLTTNPQHETVILFPNRVTRRPSTGQQQGWNKLPGYRNLFAMPKSNRLPRNMRPWTLGEPCRDSGRKFSLDRNALFARDPRAPQSGIAAGHPQVQLSSNPLSAPSSSSSASASFQTSGPPPVASSGTANPAWEDQTSWFQGIRSGLQKHLTSLSPALQRQATSTNDLNQTPRGSINSLDTEDSNVLGGDSLGGSGGYQPPSWYDIAGELSVSSPAARVCLVNPLLSQLTPDAQTTRQRRLSGLSYNHSRSSSCLTCPAAETDGRSRRNSISSPVAAASATPLGPRISPSSSSPVLAISSSGRQHNIRPPSETRSPHRAQSPASPSSPTRTRKPPLRPRPGSPPPPSSAPSPLVYRVQDLRIIATACSVCPSCLRNVYEEEIFSEWMTCEDEVNVHCPFCRYLFTPKLTLRTVAICDDSSSSPGGGGGGGVTQEPTVAPVDRTDPSAASSPSYERSRKAPFSHGLIEYTVSVLCLVPCCLSYPYS
uniref:C-myc promoter-binding protein n=1 Tax=Schistocephalus solidus TaxID=70667 RepID=A0A0V0J3B2_SCHSO